MSSTVQSVNPGKFEAGKNLKLFYSVAIAVGLITFILGALRTPDRTWFAFLLAFFYFLSIGVGGVFFAALHHASNAGWSVMVRRIAEGFSSFIPWSFALGVLLLLFGGDSLYSWFDKAYVAADPVLAGKSSYLNEKGILIRTVLFFVGWLAFAKVIVGRSLAQDQSGEVSLSKKNLGTSVAFIIFFALSYSLLSLDFLMSLEPHWFSTIFGVYAFAGLFQSTISVMILVTIYLMRSGLVKGLITVDHLHDLGKYLKAFTVFWAYIAFSQYLLIWYANLPEETIFFYHRSHGSWALVSLSLLIFKFIVPFVALLPRNAKRTPCRVGSVAVLILVMQFVDLYWLIYPNFSEEKAVFGPLEIGVFLGFMGLFAWAVAKFYSKNPVVPLKDPRAAESLAHHVTY
jgi:hypothetical protein